MSPWFTSSSSTTRILRSIENIASPLRVARMGDAEIKKRVGAMADLLRLSPMLDRKPAELSGGQQQRTALGPGPGEGFSELVLLDEPLANLDFKLREELREELAEAVRRPELHRRLRDDGTDRSPAAGRQDGDPA